MEKQKDEELKIRSPRLLRDIIDEIRSKGWIQEKIAHAIGTEQPTVSKMRTTDPDADWYKHWPLLWRLMKLCEELDVKIEDESFEAIAGKKSGGEKAE